MSKARLNYVLDVVIGVAFLLSALTGMAFLLMGEGGYQGGRNPQFQTDLLGISRATWSDLHALGGLVMITGVVLHLALHWKWILCVTRRMVNVPARQAKEQSCELAT